MDHQITTWQPIETAPKGGGAARRDDPAWVDPPHILVWLDGGPRIVYWDYYYAPGGGGYEVNCSGWVDTGGDWPGSVPNDCAPTHWMSLPAPPEAK
jgi:hypothetical protein